MLRGERDIKRGKSSSEFISILHSAFKNNNKYNNKDERDVCVLSSLPSERAGQKRGKKCIKKRGERCIKKRGERCQDEGERGVSGTAGRKEVLR